MSECYPRIKNPMPPYEATPLYNGKVRVTKTREAWEENHPHRTFSSTLADQIEREVSQEYFLTMYQEV